MLTNQEILSLREVVFDQDACSRVIDVLKETWKELTTLDAAYFDTHRNVDWADSHTQHSKHEKYSRE
jgi:hypothetical protein